MQRLDRAVLAGLLPRLVGNACPSTVPRSGTAGEQINCFTTTFRSKSDPDVVLLRVEGDEVEGLQYDGQRYSIAVSLPINQLNPDHLHVTHFYGLDEVRYEGLWAVARGLWIGWPYVWISVRRTRDAIAQRLFNRRTLSAKNRLDVLREVVEWTANQTTSIDAMDLMSARYGYRWAGHPEWESHHQKIERTLAMLVDTGDLKTVGDRFEPTGQAIKTLDESEEADRRHTANFRVQAILAVLTFVSAVMAAAQAGLLKFPVLVDFTPESGPAVAQDCRASPNCCACPPALVGQSADSQASSALISRQGVEPQKRQQKVERQ